MSALLVPKELLLACVRNSIFVGTSPKHWTPLGRSILRDHVCLRFNVSKSLAENRIEGIFPTEQAKPLPVRLVTPFVSLSRLLPAVQRLTLAGV